MFNIIKKKMKILFKLSRECFKPNKTKSGSKLNMSFSLEVQKPNFRPKKTTKNKILGASKIKYLSSNLIKLHNKQNLIEFRKTNIQGTV